MDISMDISTAWPKSHIHTWIYPSIYPWISISTASLALWPACPHCRRKVRLSHKSETRKQAGRRKAVRIIGVSVCLRTAQQVSETLAFTNSRLNRDRPNYNGRRNKKAEPRKKICNTETLLLLLKCSQRICVVWTCVPRDVAWCTTICLVSRGHQGFCESCIVDLQVIQEARRCPICAVRIHRYSWRLYGLAMYVELSNG